MQRQLADIAARGDEPIAVLWASETPIYARYGYGRASSNAYFRFERGDGAMAATHRRTRASPCGWPSRGR